MSLGTHDGAESELWSLIASGEPGSTLTPADVAAVGREAWVWQRVDEELDQILRDANDQNRRQE